MHKCGLVGLPDPGGFYSRGHAPSELGGDQLAHRRHYGRGRRAARRLEGQGVLRRHPRGPGRLPVPFVARWPGYCTGDTLVVFLWHELCIRSLLLRFFFVGKLGCL